MMLLPHIKKMSRHGLERIIHRPLTCTTSPALGRSKASKLKNVLHPRRIFPSMQNRQHFHHFFSQFSSSFSTNTTTSNASNSAASLCDFSDIAFHYRGSDESDPIGPLSFEEIAKDFQAGKLDVNTSLVWHSGMGDFWKPVEDVLAYMLLLSAGTPLCLHHLSLSRRLKQ